MLSYPDIENDRSVSRRDVVLSGGIAVAASALTGSGAMSASSEDGAGSAVQPNKLKVGMVVFDGFQLLDVFGPLEMFGHLRGKVEIVIVAETAGSIASSAGPSVVADFTFASVPKLDVVIIPGGAGTRREVNNAAFIGAFKELAAATPYVSSVCTGAALLARTGLIDGRKATTNKRAYRWATGQSDQVRWVKKARWVEDGKYFTSSGISAGMDMSLALIEKLFGRQTAEEVANGAEYHWNRDPQDDPFAKLNGLVD